MRRVFRNERGQPLTKEERRLVLRYAFVIAIPLATIATVALLVGLFYVRHQLKDQIRSNRVAIARADQAIAAHKKLTERIDELRRANDRAIGEAVFLECVENEAQDAANAALFRKVRTLVMQGPPTKAREQLLDAITDTINAREPPNEKPCRLPGAAR